MRRWAAARARARRCRTTPCRSCAAAASTPTRCAGWPPTTTRRRRVRRRLDRQGRDHPRTARDGAAAGTRLRPRDRGARRPRPLRADVRHPRGLPHPVRLPQLDRVRADIAHRPARRLVGPDDFHGAKFYRELAAADVSADFLDAVAARFAEVADAVAADCRTARRDRTREGWRRRADQRGVRHRRRQPRQARRRRDHPRAAAPGAVEGPGPAGRAAPTSPTYGCSPSSAACRSRRSPNCPTPASG